MKKYDWKKELFGKRIKIDWKNLVYVVVIALVIATA